MIITLVQFTHWPPERALHPACFFDAFKRAFNMCVCYTVIGGQLLIFDSIYSQSYVWPPARPSSGALFVYLNWKAASHCSIVAVAALKTG